MIDNKCLSSLLWKVQIQDFQLFLFSHGVSKKRSKIKEKNLAHVPKPGKGEGVQIGSQTGK
jgi:hypothetical protein